MSLLIVDDIATNGKLLRVTLEAEGHIPVPGYIPRRINLLKRPRSGGR